VSTCSTSTSRYMIPVAILLSNRLAMLTHFDATK
jgi:Ca2+:H+ antiporter